jgi:hypothetical protein
VLTAGLSSVSLGINDYSSNILTTTTSTTTIQNLTVQTLATLFEATSYLAQVRLLSSGDFHISPPGAQYGCQYDSRRFMAKTADVISAKITSSSSIDFYIISEQSFATWVKGHSCMATNALLDAYSVTSYSGIRSIPKDGTYYMLFENFSHDTTTFIHFDLQIIGSASGTHYVLFTVVSKAFLTVTQTSTESLTTGTEPIRLTMQSRSSILVAIVGLIMIVAGTALWNSRRRKYARRKVKKGIRSTYDRYLIRLEELQNAGKISDDTYVTLRSEYERRRRREKS